MNFHPRWAIARKRRVVIQFVRGTSVDKVVICNCIKACSSKCSKSIIAIRFDTGKGIERLLLESNEHDEC